MTQLQYAIRDMLRTLEPIPPDKNTVSIESVENDVIMFSFKILEVRVEQILKLQMYAGLLGYIVTNYEYFPKPLTHRDESNLMVTLTKTSMR